MPPTVAMARYAAVSPTAVALAVAVRHTLRETLLGRCKVGAVNTALIATARTMRVMRVLRNMVAHPLGRPLSVTRMYSFCVRAARSKASGGDSEHYEHDLLSDLALDDAAIER